jgi:hypothetical protein
MRERFYREVRVVGAHDREWAVVVVVRGDCEVVVGRVTGTRPDLGAVDALARLQLAARRRGWSIRLDNLSAELAGLLDLVGLADVVVGSPGSGRELGRKTESGEQLGVEEVVQSDQPSV